MNATAPAAKKNSAKSVEPIKFVAPKLRDPRLTLLLILSTYTALGQFVFYFNIGFEQLLLTISITGGLDFLINLIKRRRVEIPLSGIITGLSLGLLLESYNNIVFVVAGVWSIASKHLIKFRGVQVFNPSNFGIVMALLLMHGTVTVAPGSQWGSEIVYSLVVLSFGLVMSWRVNRLPLVLGWAGGFVLMGLVRMSLGQGGLVFVLGPMTGAEFMLFTISMVPDPKASPSNKVTQVVWGLSIALIDGVMRFNEMRFSMFYALAILCAIRPWFEAAVERVFNLTEGQTAFAGINSREPAAVLKDKAAV